MQMYWKLIPEKCSLILRSEVLEINPEKMHTAIPSRSKSYIGVTFDATPNYLLTKYLQEM
jgi:hypothetical protein